MKSNYFFNYLCFLCMVLMVFSCEKDEPFNKSHNSVSSLKINRISFDEIPHKKEVAKTFDRIKKENSNFQRKGVYDSIHGFTVHTDQAISITKGDKNWLTFYISRKPPIDTLENIVLQWDPMAKLYRSSLFRYDQNLSQSDLPLMVVVTPKNLQGKVATIEVGDQMQFPDGTCWEVMAISEGGLPDWQQIDCDLMDNSGNGDDSDSGDNGGSWGDPGTNGYYGWDPGDSYPGFGIPDPGYWGDIDFEGGGGSPGGPPPPPDGPPCDRCPPVIMTALMLMEDEDCAKIKNLIDKDVETVPKQKVKDLLQELGENTTILNKEMGYYLNPETALENNFIPFYFEGEENSDEVSINFGTNAVSTIMHIHYNNEQAGKEQLSIFSLSDLYQIYASINSGHIFNPPTFTSFVVTEHGTKYALQINDANAFLNSKLATYFVGWEFGNFRKSAEDRYEELNGISVKNSNETNEENFAKLIAGGNMGLTLLKSTDGNFENWTKIEYIDGEKIETSCN